MDLKALDRAKKLSHFFKLSERVFAVRGSMPFDRIATFIDRALPADFLSVQIRARLHNLFQSLQFGHVTIATVRARLTHVDAFFFADPANARPDRCLSALILALAAADEQIREQDHYLRPERLDDHVKAHAVTFLRNQYGRLGKNLLGVKASGDEIKAAFDRRGSGAGRPVIGSVGGPDRPIWLTPYVGSLEALCEEAQDGIGPARRAEIVRTIVSDLGLCHYDVGDELIAFMTVKPIRDLRFNLPADPTRDCEPVGPTPFEARDHRRFRNWPQPPTEAYGYGQTYALDARERARFGSRADHGLPEAVRPRLAAADIADCVVVGTLQESPKGDTDADYLDAIGAAATVSDLLRLLHRHIGV